MYSDNDFSDLFDRVRRLETRQAVGDERDKTLIEKMDALSDFFKHHDEAEMKKYDMIGEKVERLSKLFYIATGIGIVIGFIGIENIRIILGG